ncbi:hypothetical protein D3C85_1524460 [compost metagenome]
MLTQFRQDPAEIPKAPVFVGIPHLPPARVIAVLLASAGIPAGGLQMPTWIGADPYIGVGRRHRQRVEALDLIRVGHALPCRVEIAELAPQFFTGDAGLSVIDIVQVGRQYIGHGESPCGGVSGRYCH